LKTKTISVAVVGTPGTGKSVFARKLASATPNSSVIEVNDVAKSMRLFVGTDVHGTKIADTKRLGVAVRKELVKRASTGESATVVVGHLVPYLGLKFDLAVVTRCGLKELLRRLEKRHYPEQKISENILCEAMDCVGSDMIGRAGETYEVATAQDSKEVIDYIADTAAGRRPKKPRLNEIDMMKEMYQLIKAGSFDFGEGKIRKSKVNPKS